MSEIWILSHFICFFFSIKAVFDLTKEIFEEIFAEDPNLNQPVWMKPCRINSSYFRRVKNPNNLDEIKVNWKLQSISFFYLIFFLYRSINVIKAGTLLHYSLFCPQDLFHSRYSVNICSFSLWAKEQWGWQGILNPQLIAK